MHSVCWCFLLPFDFSILRIKCVFISKVIQVALAGAARNSQVLVKVFDLLYVSPIGSYAMDGGPHARPPHLRVHLRWCASLFIRTPRFLVFRGICFVLKSTEASS